MTRRKLTLRSEAVSDLTADDLAAVTGGRPLPTLPLVPCLTDALNCAIYDPNSIVCQVTRLQTCVQC